jgi:nitrite reductase/ring-hydroxylating ferredoxin subunit
MNFYPLDKLINLHDGYRQVFIVERREVLLIQEEGQRYAIQASCPHRHWPLQSATIQSDVIVCGKHGWEFRLKDGRACNHLAECGLTTYQIGYHDNLIGITLD